ncbi:MAG: glycosyltransferase family 2 protein [Deltaproteobacteria bacterium]|nr:glycosyltransferase family 2 protein [Deltaproteobacteria bacterium]MBI3386205.1 glycosyltransferase family 2 protein [Deltaproteobacteria bacterium]
MQLEHSMRLAVIIVNYRTPELTVDCLASLVGQCDANRDRVFVVDNASGDGSTARIPDAIAANGWGRWVQFQSASLNGGFAVGNNLVLRSLLASSDPPRYVFLLNPDTIVQPGAIDALLEFMELHPDVGIAGSGQEDVSGAPLRAAFRFPTVVSEIEAGMRLGYLSKLLAAFVVAPLPPTQPSRTDWVAGACMLVRREVFQRVGLLDEGFFLCFEDVDFCRRAADAGFPCWYVPQSRIIHLVGQASGPRRVGGRTQRRPACWFDARRHYFEKHFGVAYRVLADVGFAFTFLLWRMRRVVQRKPDADPPYFLIDFLRHSIFGGRRRAAPDITRS